MEPHGEFAVIDPYPPHTIAVKVQHYCHLGNGPKDSGFLGEMGEFLLAHSALETCNRALRLHHSLATLSDRYDLRPFRLSVGLSANHNSPF